MDCNAGAITVIADVWLGGDPHCCPSARDVGTFSFLEESLRLLFWTRVAVRDQTKPVK